MSDSAAPADDWESRERARHSGELAAQWHRVLTVDRLDSHRRLIGWWRRHGRNRCKSRKLMKRRKVGNRYSTLDVRNLVLELSSPCLNRLPLPPPHTSSSVMCRCMG